jgi:hypothetical protein
MRELRLCVSHVWDPNIRLAVEYGRVNPFCVVVDRFDEMAGKVDGIMVSDPRAVAFHPRLARPFLRRGTPVWIDGPFAYSMSDARKLIEMAAAGRTAIVAATAEEFLPLTGWLRRKARELAPLTAAMVLVSTQGRSADKWAGVEGVNLSCAIFGSSVRKVCRVAASATEPTYALTLEYRDLPGDHPLNVVVHGAASETDRVWARLYGNDMCEGRQAFSDDRSEDWLGTFVPAALAVQRTFSSKLSPQASDYLLAKTKLCLACYKSSLVPEGKQLSVQELEDDWKAE